MDWITSVREIKKAQENNQLVIFVGAGVSKNSGVPTWWELIKKFAKEIGYDKCTNCNEKKKDCQNNECKKRYDFTQEEFLRIPEYYYQKYKGECEKYYNLIQDTLRGGSGSNLIDDEIFNLLPHHIITTNYDSLLEDSIAINSRLYTVVARDSDLLSKASEHYIIKMHGDLNLPETIVLKESDYIDYEQKHPLISTFIRSLLVNHTFVFLGYSLNDYNLNLIIGWINYFRKFHGVERRPSNYLIDSKPATLFEDSRLKDKNIYVVDTGSLPDTILEKINVSDSFSDPIGRKLLAYLKCISDEKIIQEYIPLEKRLIEKYQPLQAYKKISYQDLIAVHPFGRTKFLDTELVFYEKTWFDKIGEILGNVNSPVVEIFRRAGISAIHFFNDDVQIAISGTYEPIDKNFALYLDNDYIRLNEELKSCENPIQKLYYNHLIGRNEEELKILIDEISENMSSEDYISVVLHKTRTRTALLTLFDRQEERTSELEKIFDTALPKYRKAISFLRMLFESMAKNMYQMEKALEKHEERYEYKNGTIYCDHAFVNLWEIKSYAYDYYFFFIENGIPIHYFSDPKEYLSYYLKAILCTYAPTKQNSNDMEIPIAREVNHYVLGEVELDMLVKYTNPKSLQTWIRKYSVQELEIDEDINVVKKFANLCNSFVKFRIRYWTNQIKNFSFILCLLNLNEKQRVEIFSVITNVIEELASVAPQANEEIFEAIEHIVCHMNIGNSPKEYANFINVITDEKVYSVIANRYASKLQKILRKLGKFSTPQIRQKFETECDLVEDEMALFKKMYSLRFFISREKSKKFFNDHSDMLTIEQIFDLLINGLLDYNEKLWIKFVDKIKAEDEARKKNPGMRTYPDWLMVTLEYSLLLKLFKFPIELGMLKPYVKYSEHLLFMLNPSKFDYSKVDISNYMWQNLIYSKEYRKYFVDHKDKLLTEQLKDIFALGVDTVEQQKIVYGILLEDDEIQRY